MWLDSFSSDFKYEKLIKCMSALVVVLSLLLLTSISIEVFSDVPFLEESINFKVQLAICSYFIFDFFLFFLLAKDKWGFFKRYWFILVLSFPYLAIFNALSVPLSYEETFLIRFIPVLRGCVAITILILMVINKNANTLLFSYFALVFSVAYFLSLIFYIFERNVNPEVHTYGDVLWWGSMSVTTLGPDIIPITPIGKITTFVLAALGMTVFPIITVYINNKVMSFTESQLKRVNKHTSTKTTVTPNTPSDNSEPTTNKPT